MEAKQAAETDPTYPNPKTLTDKPKRISRQSSIWLNYTNATLSHSKSDSIEACDCLDNIFVFNILRIILKAAAIPPAGGAKSGQQFPLKWNCVGSNC
jgi:hypothetical protein